MAVQSDAITARILQDAEVKAQEIKNSYDLKIDATLLEAQNYAKQKQKECKELAKQKQSEIIWTKTSKKNNWFVYNKRRFN